MPSTVCFFRESGPGNQEDKTVISSVRLLRSRFHRPKPNLRTTSRKEVTDINKGVSQEDTNKKESSMQSTDECCVLLDTDVRLFFFFFLSLFLIWISAYEFVELKKNI